MDIAIKILWTVDAVLMSFAFAVAIGRGIKSDDDTV